MRNPDSTERFLWLLLLLLAAVLRLAGLGTAPLSSAEAVQALAAYGAAHGGGIPPEARTLSPLLFHVNVLLFTLFHGGDGLARLFPALCGVGLTLTPLLLRRYLGRWGALGSGLLLTLSPTLLALSRTLDGSIPAALGVMLLVGAVARFLDSWRSAWVPLGGVGLALALTAGPAAWGLLLGLAHGPARAGARAGRLRPGPFRLRHGAGPAPRRSGRDGGAISPVALARDGIRWGRDQSCATI
jgi:predicted membrane-bound mannosyltransferase